MDRSKDPISPEQLRWCQANRQRQTRTESIGALAAKIGAVLGRSDGGDRAVFDAILAVVDDQFRSCCRFGGVRGGQVIILVEPAYARYHSVLRTRWHLHLREHLERVCRGTTIRSIQFKLGTDGASFQAG